MIKIKEAGPGLRTRISCDKDGNELTRTPSFNKKSPLWAESEEWLKDNEILPQFTEQEIIDNEQKAQEQALSDQKNTLINLIKDNEYHLISRRFKADVSAWEIALDKWAEQLELNEIVEIYPKPFKTD